MRIFISNFLKLTISLKQHFFASLLNVDLNNLFLISFFFHSFNFHQTKGTLPTNTHLFAIKNECSWKEPLTKKLFFVSKKWLINMECNQRKVSLISSLCIWWPLEGSLNEETILGVLRRKVVFLKEIFFKGKDQFKGNLSETLNSVLVFFRLLKVKSILIFNFDTKHLFVYNLQKTNTFIFNLIL